MTAVEIAFRRYEKIEYRRSEGAAETEVLYAGVEPAKELDRRIRFRMMAHGLCGSGNAFIQATLSLWEKVRVSDYRFGCDLVKAG